MRLELWTTLMKVILGLHVKYFPSQSRNVDHISGSLSSNISAKQRSQTKFFFEDRWGVLVELGNLAIGLEDPETD